MCCAFFIRFCEFMGNIFLKQLPQNTDTLHRSEHHSENGQTEWRLVGRDPWKDTIPGMEQPPSQERQEAMINVQDISVAAYGAQVTAPTAKGNGKTSTSTGTTASNAKEQLQLSDTSVLLQSFHEVIDALPDVRIPLVQQLQQKIKDDGYPIETNIYKALTSGKLV